VEANVVFQHLSHQAVDATSNIGQQHQDIRAVISCRKGTLNRIHPPADSSDPGDQLLFFFFKMAQFFLCISYGGML
jgi:hypothetical protein